MPMQPDSVQPAKQSLLMSVAIAGAAVGVIALGTGIFIGLAFLLGAPGTRPVKKPEPPEIIKIDLHELLAANEKNPVATYDKYRGKILETSGRIASMDSGWNVYIDLESAPAGRISWRQHVTIYFPHQMVPQLKQHDVGSHVRVQMTMNEMNPRMKATAVSIETIP